MVISLTKTKMSQDHSEVVKDYYTLNKIYRFERVWGPTWVSIGGEQMAKMFSRRMNLKVGQKVLDIGCGTGGTVYHIARQYGCIAHGIDLCQTMIALCHDRLKREQDVVQKRVTFETGDVTKLSFPENEFDVIFSKQTFLHIDDKDLLFAKIHAWLKPGGKLLFCDYVSKRRHISQDFEAYLHSKAFHVITPEDYLSSLRKAGFQEIEEKDLTDLFVQVSEEELDTVNMTKEAFIQDFSQEDYDWVVDDWSSKIQQAKSGDLSWQSFCTMK